MSHVTIVEDDNLLPSPHFGFSLEADFSALRPKINHFRTHKKCYFPVNLSFFNLFMHMIVVTI